MKILIAFSLNPELEALLVDDNVAYRPDLAVKGPHALRNALCAIRPDVLIASGLPPAGILERWRAEVPAERRLTCIEVGPAPSTPTNREAMAGIDLHHVDSASGEPEMAAVLLAETRHCGGLGRPAPARSVAPDRPRSVALVGAGIVNLITAYALARDGYAVTLHDAGPDPSLTYDWEQHGCTFGGGDARIFSLNEGRHHHAKGHVIGAATNAQFERTVAEGGWLSRTCDALVEPDLRWIEAFERVPAWLASRYDRDIISFNQESQPLWRGMMQEAPDLFDGVGFRDGLVRLYATRQKLERGLAVERSIGAFRRQIALDRLVEEMPSLRDAVEAGQVAGALDVVGFSVNIQKFGRAIARRLEAAGGRLHWNSRVGAVVRDRSGRVVGLRTEEGLVEADHYVVSAGAYGNDLLEGFESSGQIAPVIGMWLTLPDAGPTLERPLKINRAGYASDGAAEGANVIPGCCPQGEPVIHVSSGHGYIGLGPQGPDPAQLADLARAVEETARDFFPSRYAQARDAGLIPEVKRYCIRPWTPSGLGLFETAPAAGGGLCVVTGGHNTGGFAQAPSVARAVLAAIEGREHPMHTLYHPRRFAGFAGLDAALVA